MFQEWETLVCISEGVLRVYIPPCPPWSAGGGWEVCKQLPGADTSRALLLLLPPPELRSHRYY